MFSYFAYSVCDKLAILAVSQYQMQGHRAVKPFIDCGLRQIFERVPHVDNKIGGRMSTNQLQSGSRQIFLRQSSFACHQCLGDSSLLMNDGVDGSSDSMGRCNSKCVELKTINCFAVGCYAVLRSRVTSPGRDSSHLWNCIRRFFVISESHEALASQIPRKICFP